MILNQLFLFQILFINDKSFLNTNTGLAKIEVLLYDKRKS